MFSGKTVVVTGSGRGIGQALALGFALQGATVLVHYGHARERAEEVVGWIEATGGRAMLAQADLTKTEDVNRLVEEARTKLGAIDIWINNAGASANSVETQGMSEEEILRRVMDVDVMGTWRCCNVVKGQMRAGGCILTIGWNHVFDGALGFINEMYAMSKGSIVALTRCLAQELAPQIRVNCIAPGWIENDWTSSRPVSFQQKVEQTIPIGRWGTPEDIVGAAIFLASPAASFITGQVLVVDGGEVIR